MFILGFYDCNICGGSESVEILIPDIFCDRNDVCKNCGHVHKVVRHPKHAEISEKFEECLREVKEKRIR